MRLLTGALVVLAVVLLGAGCDSSGPGGTERPGDRATSGGDVPPPGRYAPALTRAANEARSGEGLEPMRESRCLARAAGRRAVEIAGGPLEHRPLPDVARRCTESGRVAENLVRSAATPDEVAAAWMESTGHRNNLVDPALGLVGTGCRPDGAELLCVQLYAEDARHG